MENKTKDRLLLQIAQLYPYSYNAIKAIYKQTNSIDKTIEIIEKAIQTNISTWDIIKAQTKLK